MAHEKTLPHGCGSVDPPPFIPEPDAPTFIRRPARRWSDIAHPFTNTPRGVDPDRTAQVIGTGSTALPAPPVRTIVAGPILLSLPGPLLGGS